MDHYSSTCVTSTQWLFEIKGCLGTKEYIIFIVWFFKYTYISNNKQFLQHQIGCKLHQRLHLNIYFAVIIDHQVVIMCLFLINMMLFTLSYQVGDDEI